MHIQFSVEANLWLLPRMERLHVNEDKMAADTDNNFFGVSMPFLHIQSERIPYFFYIVCIYLMKET